MEQEPTSSTPVSVPENSEGIYIKPTTGLEAHVPASEPTGFIATIRRTLSSIKSKIYATKI